METNYPDTCPIQGGHTQQVITSGSALGAVYLACPETHLPPTYTDNQKWIIHAF